MTKYVPVINRKMLPAVAVGTAVALGIGVLVTVDATRAVLVDSWWVLLVLAVAFLLLVRHHLGALVPRRRPQRQLSPKEQEKLLIEKRKIWSQRRAALVMFVAAPALIFLLGGVAVLPERLHLVALRAALLLVVCLLPAILWYLFITTRRASLLNEFLANLDRLGLMHEQAGEQDVPKRRRISGYLQRFGAVYGDLPEVVHKTVQDNKFERYTRDDFSGATGMTTAAVPVLTTTALISIGWLLTLPPAEVISREAADSASAVVAWIDALTPTLQPITLAFIGAYFFSIQMLFRRYALKDLRGSAYISVSMRIILAIIGVWVLTVVNGRINLLDEGMLYMLSFAIGVFPLVLWQIISHHLKKLKFLTVPSMRSALPLDQLDGLTVWHQARLEEEDIENIPNMATADLVDLLLNTRLAPNRIIDWTDQAILYTQLGKNADDKRKQLHARGIRNATTFLLVAADEQATLFDDVNHQRLVPALVTAIRANSNLKLIECWRRVCEHAQPPATQETVVLPVPVSAGVRDS